MKSRVYIAVETKNFYVVSLCRVCTLTEYLSLCVPLLCDIKKSTRYLEISRMNILLYYSTIITLFYILQIIYVQLKNILIFYEIRCKIMPLEQSKSLRARAT